VDREVERMEIQVNGTTVTLRGTVNSWHERDAAQGVAWAAPGVRSVINELRIA
jgi:osmotically-inducible protein OsmY